MTRYWIGVAARDRVKAAEAGGFCQFCHGRQAPARRLCEGDGLVYYSARETMSAGAAVRAFTAIGRVKAGDAYRAAHSDGFTPWRRQVAYWPATDAPVAPLLDRLSFSAHGANRGLQLRKGLFEITADDFRAIMAAMGVSGAQI